MNRRLLVAILCTAPLFAPVARATSAEVTAFQAPLDADTAATIKKLKLQADDALQDKNPEGARKLYQQILRLDPDDPLARQQLEKLETREKQDKETERDKRVTDADRDAKNKDFQQKLAAAERLILTARTSGESAPLDEAEGLLKTIRTAQPTFAGLDRVQQLLEEERRIQRTRAYEFWGLIGVALAAILVPTGLYFWRGKHTMEMVEGPLPGQVFPMGKPTTRIGALASECDVTISDPLRKISRHHCDIIRQGRHYFLVDRSTNGTHLNGQPANPGEPVLLRRGDRISLSSEVTLVFR